MNASDYTCDQPEKNAARQRIITAAVRALTTERSSSLVVTSEAFDKTLDYYGRQLEKCGGGRVSKGMAPHAAAYWISTVTFSLAASPTNHF
jgi:hypothetical protein